MLTSAVNIQELDLELVEDHHIESSARPQDSWLSSVVRGGDGILRNDAIFPRLTKLFVGKMVCQEVELIALIHNHRHSLKQVCLRDIILVHSPGDRSAACWVRVLHKIRTKGINYRFIGHFTNQSCQWWDVAYGLTPSKSSLKARLLEWLGSDDNTECPLERAAVRLDKDGNEVIVPVNNFKGDHTWRLQLRFVFYPPDEGFVYNEGWGPGFDDNSDTFAEDDDDLDGTEASDASDYFDALQA